MESKMKLFFNEALFMGDVLLDLIGRDHESYPLAKVLVNHTPTLKSPDMITFEYVCMVMGLGEKEVNGMLVAMKKVVDEYFYHKEVFNYHALPSLNIPVNGTLFLFTLTENEVITIKLNRTINLEENSLVFPGFLESYFHDHVFRVGTKSVRMDYAGILYVYSLVIDQRSLK
jgi:hypothetical protein